jgi:hypothetical protein
MMKLGRENGFFVTYNHPVWSCEDFSDYIGYENMHAMEIMNNTCIRMGLPEYNDKIYDDILRSGKRIFCTATDDGHGMEQHCKGWVMVNAKKDVNSVLKALEAGEFYSSCGPEIYDFYVEDGKAVLECSPVSCVRLHSDGHATKVLRSEDGSITRAQTELGSLPFKYVRVSVIDKDGKMAWTNPIFLED